METMVVPYEIQRCFHNIIKVKKECTIDDAIFMIENNDKLRESLYLISKDDYDYLNSEAGKSTTKIISINNKIYNDYIGFSSIVKDKMESINDIDGLNVLSIDECINIIKGLNKDHDYNWILEKIREFHINKLSISIKSMNRYMDIIKSLE